MQLVRPGPDYLAGYVAALERGCSANNERGIDATREELARIQADAVAFLASMEDREAKGPPVFLPDGSTARRIPGFKRWMWDGEFCGSIGLRWQPGTTALPPHRLGHIGYAVVPWKQRLGYAKWCLNEASRGSLSLGAFYCTSIESDIIERANRVALRFPDLVALRRPSRPRLSAPRWRCTRRARCRGGRVGRVQARRQRPVVTRGRVPRTDAGRDR